MARATGGGVGFWLELPIRELIAYLAELGDQLQAEQEAAERR